MKLPKTKLEVEIKGSLLYGEVAEYKEAIFKGAKSTVSGELDQISIIGNVEGQKIKLIMAWVISIEGKPVTEEGLKKLDYPIFKEIFEICKKRHEDLVGEDEDKKK